MKSKAKAAAKKQGADQPSQEVKRELRRALTKQQTVASKLLERRAKLERNDAALWGGIVKKISSAMEELGELQCRGKAKSAGQEELQAIVAQTKAMEDVLAEVSA